MAQDPASYALKKYTEENVYRIEVTPPFKDIQKQIIVFPGEDGPVLLRLLQKTFGPECVKGCPTCNGTESDAS